MNSILIKRRNFFIVFLIPLSICYSCERANLLNEKPNSLLVVPSTIEDFQALLDLSSEMNATPSLGDLSADNYYLVPFDYNGFTVSNAERNAYLWKPEIFDANVTVPSWNLPYKQALTANVVLEGLNKMTLTNTNEQSINALKGAALFYRAYAFFNIAQLFAPMYDSATAASDLGIPLRLTSDISEKSVRSSLKETYDRIFEDLEQANNLLPAALPVNNRNRPCKIAVQALLARIYLSMRAYTKAGVAADNALQMYSTLLDYNTISQTANLPFSRNNAETIYQSNFESSSKVLSASVGVGYLDSNLYKSYASNDLRKILYFRLVNNLPRLKGSYAFSTFPFTGLAVDELYLIRAECYARAGNRKQAMSDLNTLLQKRFSDTYIPLTASGAGDALSKVLTERRKELVVRGTRWSDLRRLNKEGYNIILRRTLDDQFYTLPAGSPLYVLPIPANVIALTGMQQNLR